MTIKEQHLLEQKIADLPIGEEVKEILSNGNISTLKMLLEMEVCKWRDEIPRFNYHHQHEMITYVMNQELTGYLREE